MRLSVLSVLALLAATPAMAQQLSPMTGTTSGPPTVGATPPVAPPATTSATPPRRPRITMQERFDAANTTHDGKLTLAQAQAAHYRRVVQNFDAIDTAKHGYVTMDDIHAFNRAQRQARKAARESKPQ